MSRECLDWGTGGGVWGNFEGVWIGEVGDSGIELGVLLVILSWQLVCLCIASTASGYLQVYEGRWVRVVWVWVGRHGGCEVGCRGGG